ncbi:hypothetical protein KXD40_002155 [Peronospora effusa]|nr:hypothetical protein KXD40_002155 [Peronospora effusa]
MTSHHHRSGPLKQKNKKHKTGRHESKTLLARRRGGKVEGRRVSACSSGSSLSSMGLTGQKAARLQRQKQLRGNKREEMLLQRRFGLGSALGPPKIVALVGLSDQANLIEVRQSILEDASTVEESQLQDVAGLKNCTIGVFNQHKQKLCVVDCGCNLLVALDAAKVADVIVFVLSMHNGADGGLSEEGVRIVSAVRAQGLPTTVGLIQGLEQHTPKCQTELKKLGTKYFATEFGESAKVAVANVLGQLSRVLITLSPKVIHWREARSYMLATAATFVPGTEMHTQQGEQVGELQVNGYLRGKPLSVNQLIHITDVGTFQLSRITRGVVRQVQREKVNVVMNVKRPIVSVVPQAGQDAELVLAMADPALQEDLRFEAEYDPFAAEQTWPTNEELAEAEVEAKKQRHAEAAANIGASSYQAAWLDGEDDVDEEDRMKDTEEEEDSAINQDFCKTGEDDDNDDDDMFMVDDDYVDQAQKRKDEDKNMTFPDEVDTPVDQPARVRFARYRGMKSLRTSAWDPKESLPADYSRLFQFADFAMVQRLALARGKDAERAMKDQLRRKTKIQQTRFRASSMAMEDVEDAASVASLSLAKQGGSVKDDDAVAQHEKMTKFVAATAPLALRLPLFRPWSSTKWTWLEKLMENVVQVAAFVKAVSELRDRKTLELRCFGH